MSSQVYVIYKEEINIITNPPEPFGPDIPFGPDMPLGPHIKGKPPTNMNFKIPFHPPISNKKFKIVAVCKDLTSANKYMKMFNYKIVGPFPIE